MKHNPINYFFPLIFCIIFCLLLNTHTVSASVNSNTTTNIQLSKDTSIIDARILKTTQDVGDNLSSPDITYEGYNIKLSLSNNYANSPAIYVEIIPTKINGLDIGNYGKSIFNYSNGSDYSNIPYVKTNGTRVPKGATFFRTATIPYEYYKTLKTKRINKLSGYLKVTDNNGNILLDENNGSFDITLESGSSNDSSASKEYDSSKYYSLKYAYKNYYWSAGDTYTLYIGGDMLDLVLSDIDDNIVADNKIVWKSSEPDIAIVDNSGRISSLQKEGVTIISATYNNVDYILPVEVKKPTLTITPSKIAVGTTTRINFEVNPDLEEDKEITFTSKNSDILTIQGDKMTGVAPGIAEVTATYYTGTGNQITANTYIRVEAKKETGTSKPTTVKAPTLTCKGNIYIADKKVSAVLSNAHMSEDGYELNFLIKNLSSEHLSYNIEITSINGLKFKQYDNYGIRDFSSLSSGENETEKLTITPKMFTQLGTMEISEIRGTFSFDTSSTDEESHEFTIKPNNSPSTSYERVLPGGKAVSINNSDIAMEITSITEQYYLKNPYAIVNFYITNKSTTKRLYLEGNVERINGTDVLENIVFINADTGILYPGEKMYGRFTVPCSTYMRYKRSIKSMVFNINIRTTDKKSDFNTTISLDDLNVLSSKEEILTISGDCYLTAGDVPEPYRVYDDVSLDESYSYYSQPVDNKTLIWSTSDPNIMTVSPEGTVTPLSPGYAFLSAKDNQGRIGTFLITVKPPEIKIYQETMYVDTFDKPLVTVTPSTDSVKSKITIGSQNSDIIEARSGYVIAKKAGTATITASYPREDGTLLTSTCVVTVLPLEQIVLDKDAVSMYLDDNGNYEIKHLIATAKNNNYYSDKIFQATWSSSNSNVVTVIPINKYASTYDKNLLKNVPLQDFTGEAILIPKSAGEATITVSYGGKTDTCLVTVSAPGQDNREQDNKQGETDPSLPMPNPVNPGETFTEPNTGATYVITNDGGVRFESTNNPKATKVVIPDYITIKGKNYPVTSISDNAFSKNKSLKNLVVGKNVAVIGKKAFNSATNLRKVDMKSSNVEKIESSAFKNCKNLRSLKINANTLKTVAKGAFKGSRKKVKVTVYAKDKKSFNSCVKKLTKGGLKTASYKYKKK